VLTQLVCLAEHSRQKAPNAYLVQFKAKILQISLNFQEVQIAMYTFSLTIACNS